MMINKERIWPDVAIPPGRILAEELLAREMTQAEFARRTGRPKPAINEIINGLKQITPETAIQFERVLGIPAHVWINLERNYQYNKARLNDLKHLRGESKIINSYPVNEMVKLGWIKKQRKQEDKTKELLTFLGVNSFKDLEPQGVSFRVSSRREVNKNSIRCWLRKGQIEAQNVITKKFSEECVLQNIENFRLMTLKSVREFQPRLLKLCSDCGIALVLVRELKNTHVFGASFWETPTKVVILLSLLYKKHDQFWFSFFHEIGHILKGKKKTTYIDIKSKRDDDMDDEENKANNFASDILIPPHHYNEFIENDDFSLSSIVSFANSIDIAPGIVVGRLQHDKHIDYTHGYNLKKTFVWA